MEPVTFGMAGFSLMSGMGGIGLTTSATATAVTTAATATTVVYNSYSGCGNYSGSSCHSFDATVAASGRRGRRSCGPGRFGKGTAG